MKINFVLKLFCLMFGLSISGVSFAQQGSNLANFQQGFILSPCMYALLNGETKPRAYNVVMKQIDDSLTFTVDSVELAKEGECDEYSPPIDTAASLGLNMDDIIPEGCEDINGSIKDVFDNISLGLDESDNAIANSVGTLITNAISSGFDNASYSCDEWDE
ncbi:MAG: hypothetical protein QM479_14705 [Pseudomonadota bacterium]